ncbi:24174_t:CDS:1, partial [Gigaspora rosea]
NQERIDNKELTTEQLEEVPISTLSINKNNYNYFIPKLELNEYSYLEFRRKHQRIPTAEELLEGTYSNNKEYELAKNKEK